MKTRITLMSLVGATLFFAGVVVARAQPKKASEEHERKVSQKDVPAAALEALKRLAGKNELIQIEEETEHGQTYYEGAWLGPQGRIEALVTTGGDLVETEEVVKADQVPHPVMDAIRKVAGKDAKLYLEKKTMWLYEVKFDKGPGRHEYLFFPDGRVSEHEEKGQGDKDE